jgi:glycerol-3-phosphate cytidylyltransferase
MARVVLTYGTFDLFHIGHLNLLNRLSELGDKLIVAVSTDEFNSGKGKQTIVPFKDRLEIVQNIKCVDLAISETSWDQKVTDIKNYDVDVFGMGNDWEGKFDFLKEHCEVKYLPRTDSISSTDLKKLLKVLDKSHVEDLKTALDLISTIVKTFER